jgi:hypothetical protein
MEEDTLSSDWRYIMRNMELTTNFAVINLKEASGGKGTAELAVINGYAWMNREFLHRQVEQINPEIILAC